MIGMQAQKERDIARRAAIRRSGRNFITLKLLDTRKRRIAGVEIVNAVPGEDENGAPVFLTTVIGGELVFEPDPEYGMDMICHMLDSEHNRDFLVSHHAMGWWKIEIKNDQDRAVVMEIERRAKSLKSDIRLPKELEVQSFTVDQIRARKEELKAQLAALEDQEKGIEPVEVDIEEVSDEIGNGHESEEISVLKNRIKSAKRKYAAASSQKSKEKWAQEITECESQLESMAIGELVIEE